jgi:hypothetical protein
MALARCSYGIWSPTKAGFLPLFRRCATPARPSHADATVQRIGSALTNTSTALQVGVFTW